MGICSLDSEAMKDKNTMFDFSTMPRCKAIASTTGKQCRRAAVKGQKYCGIHSGRYKPGPKVYNRPRFLHGYHTKEAQNERAEARKLINMVNNLTASIDVFF